MSSVLMGKTIVGEEHWYKDSDKLNLHYFLFSLCGKIYHLLIVDGYDQYDKYVEISLEEKEKLIAENMLTERK